jgi:hypothetical protein
MSFNKADSGTMEGAAKNQPASLVVGVEGGEKVAETDEKENKEHKRTTLGNAATDWITIYMHELGVPLSQSQPPPYCISHTEQT